MRRSSREIIRDTANAFGLPMPQMMSLSRRREVSWPRFAAMKIMRDERDLSLNQIGKFFGRMDHTSVRHGIARAAEFLETDPDFAECYNGAVRITHPQS